MHQQPLLAPHLPKQVFEGRPQIARDRPDRKLHTGFSLLLVPYCSSTLDPRAHGAEEAIAPQRVGLIFPGTIEFRWCRLGGAVEKLSASSKYAQQFSHIFALNDMQSSNRNDHRFSPYRWTRPAMH
jgi:hypothetical protein